MKKRNWKENSQEDIVFSRISDTCSASEYIYSSYQLKKKTRRQKETRGHIKTQITGF